MLDDLFSRLEAESRDHAPGYVARMEGILAQLAATDDPQIVGRLVPFFDDDAEYDELMFSIVHLIEHFSDDVYLRAILERLPSFVARSPRWAAIIHIRILNSPAALTNYTALIEGCSAETIRAVRQVLEDVRRRGLRFAERCDKLLELVDRMDKRNGTSSRS